MDIDVRTLIETAVSASSVQAVSPHTLSQIDPLSGGCIGQVYRVTLTNGEQLVAKVDVNPQPKLTIEGFMLQYLASYSELPVPQVIYNDDRLLLMTFLPGGSHFGSAAQQHAAELLATLHNITAPAFGLERDTLIGGLHQPNPWTDSWLHFFGEHRLIYMAEQGAECGRLPQPVLHRVRRFCEHLDKWLVEPKRPSLIHGDVWTTNVLAQAGRISGFVDPAIYFADPEIELAFTTLFGTFGEPFFERYGTIRPLRPGFFSERRDIYNLYPLLVHVCLFGGSYVGSVDRILTRFGY